MHTFNMTIPTVIIAATQFCEQGYGVVIIDNTHVQRWETDFYVKLASRCGYVVVMITPRAQYTTPVKTLALRNTHEVGIDVIRQKLEVSSSLIGYVSY